MVLVQNKPSTFQILAWNANGLKRQRLQLAEVASRHDLDIILVSETHLRAADQPKIANYTLYKTDREDRNGGGTAVYVKSSLKHYPVTVGVTDNLEVTAVELETANSGTIRISSVYQPPSRPLLASDLDSLFESAPSIIAAGDFNSKHPSWNSRVSNGRGAVLRAYLDAREMTAIGPIEPTHHHPNGSNDILDIAVLKAVSLQFSIETIHELDSDHNPILLTIGDDPRADDIVTTTHTYWPAFTDHLQRTLPHFAALEDTHQLEQAVDTLTSSIQQSLEATSTTKEARRSKPQIPDWIKDLIREKNHARKISKRTWDPIDRSRYNRLKDEVSEALKEHRNEEWDKKMDSFEEDQVSYWRVSKILRNKKTPMPPLHGERGVAFRVEDKAEAFADSMERQCTLNLGNADLDHMDRIERSVQRRLKLHAEPIRPANPAEISSFLRKTNVRKAPGPDSIGNRALHHLPVRAVSFLTIIINAMLTFRHFPSQWKRADVIMLQKPRQPSNFPQSYRPISLLSTLGKTAEGIILTRLKAEVEEKNVLPAEQFGFRERHATVHQALRIVEQVSEGFNRRESTGAVFLDVSKAFDRVWHQGLVYKLLEAGVHPGLVQLIASYLRGRYFCIKLDGERSSERPLEAGVPQGSLLSPLLYNIYTSDIPRTEGTTLALFADDTAICATSRDPRLITRRLQAAMEELEDWCDKWLIAVNPEKSTSLFLTKRRHRPEEEVTMFDAAIPWRNNITYLGIVFDRGLIWKDHISNALRKANIAFAGLYPMFNRRSKLSCRNKLRLYTAIIRPIITYGMTVWGYAAKTHLKKLEVFQMKMLRIATKAPWYLRNQQIRRETGIPTIEDYIKTAATKTFASLVDHPNQIVRNICDYDEDQHHRHKRPRMILRQIT